jgi:hypothetical protein
VRNPRPQLDRLVGRPTAPTSPSGRSLAAAPPPIPQGDPPSGRLAVPRGCGSLRRPSGRRVHKLYFTEIKLGTPPKRYFVQVDTGSDIL